MKKLLLILILFATGYTASAQGANLTISTTGNHNLKIRFNGKKYSLQDRSATFQNILPGNYPLTIYQWQTRSNGNAEYVEVFNNNITLTAYKHLEITVLRFGKTAWDEGPIVSDSWWDGSVNPIGGNGSNNNSSNQSVDENTFNKMKKTISDATYDNQMLSTAKVVMKNNWFTTAQIIELCKLLSYDNNKLALAKYGYDYCMDKNQYFTIADVFDYPSNKSSFMEFLNGK